MFMSGSDYEKWWDLHLRVAKGESLSDQEASIYESGLDQLDSQQTHADESLKYLQALRTAIQRADMLHQDLAARSTVLDKKIVALESAYQQLTGQMLDMGPHAFA